MKKIKIIVLSYVTRKVLILSEKYDFLSFDLYNKSITPELLDLIQTRYFNYMGRYLNFFISHPLCEIENTIYLLAFSCVEHFPNSKLSYNWVDLINIKSSVFLKNILSKNIYKKIKIKYNKNCLFKFNNKVIHGSKQSYSRIVPLKIIHQEISIYNDPNILDCFYLNNIVEKSKINTDEFIIDEKESKSWSIVNMLPALLKKHRKVIMHTTPQGCNIGDRSLGIYFYIMKLFGVKIEIGNSKTFLEYNPVPQNREINIPVFASYTATSMAVYFSLLNGSITKIKNISIEPEIIFLLKCINKLGYSYDLNGRTLLIDGSRNKKVSLSQKLYIPIDRNVLVTQIIDALYENNTYKYNSLNKIYLDGLYFQLKTFGINIECNNYEIKIPKKQHIKNNKYVCNFGHYPELCSDWQPLITLLLCKNNNESIIYDSLFNNRYQYLYQLKKVMPNISFDIYNNLAVVNGSTNPYVEIDMRWGVFSMLDIRSAAAVIISLSKCYNFELSNIEQIFRGYEQVSDISPKLGSVVNYEFE